MCICTCLYVDDVCMYVLMIREYSCIGGIIVVDVISAIMHVRLISCTVGYAVYADDVCVRVDDDVISVYC